MAKLSYNWSKVKRGDIISFRYQNKEGRTLRRTILVLEPKLTNEAKNPKSKFLMHGIQLEVSNQPINAASVMEEILDKAGLVEVVDEEKKVYRVEIEANSQTVYTSLKSLIKQHGIYRTYNYDKAKSSQVFLEDLRLSPQYVKDLLNES